MMDGIVDHHLLRCRSLIGDNEFEGEGATEIHLRGFDLHSRADTGKRCKAKVRQRSGMSLL
ncbi:hypothetical protein D3C71_2127130 [compost metagenome]